MERKQGATETGGNQQQRDVGLDPRQELALRHGAPGDDGCDAAGSFECHLPPLPDGLDAARPTRILGAGWDVGCPSPPELWGGPPAERGIGRLATACVKMSP
ncbi:MAG: hypothetical protein GY769_18135 [bacterium]|nr:hypothetical protein [bacterium]